MDVCWLQWFSALIESNSITLFFFLSLAASCRVENFGLLLLCYRGRSVPLLCGARDKLKLNWSDRAAACHRVESAGHLSMFPADASWQTTALEIIKAWEETLACYLIPQNTSKMFFLLFFFSYEWRQFFLVALSHDVNSQMKTFRSDVILAMFVLQFGFFFFFCWRKKKTKHTPNKISQKCFNHIIAEFDILL